MKFIFFIISFIFSFTLFGASDASKIYLVANANDADSVALANLYAERRAVPKSNIIKLDIKYAKHISAQDYFEKFETPLIDKLISLGAIRAEKTGEKVFKWRDELKFSGHDIDFIILFRGIPVGILQDGEGGGTSANSASVDSELSARFAPMQSRSGFIKNPLYAAFDEASQFKNVGVLRVFRLDGATKSDVEKNFLRTLQTEERGLRGRVYIDKCKREKSGDAVLQQAGDVLKKAGFDTSVDDERGLFDYDKRMDGAAFYFGWYSYYPEKYFYDKTFRMVRGAVAIHIYSFSAIDMRASMSWTPRFVALGASTVGNVFEPYLQFTHNAGALAFGLVAKKMNFGEAAYAAQPVLSWQTVSVGDPLYQPFKKDLLGQIKDIESGNVDEYSQYAVIRLMNLAEEKNGLGGAIKLGESFMGKLGSYDEALLWKLSEKYQEIGDTQKAVSLASKVLRKDIYSSSDLWGLAIEAAKFLGENGKSAQAMSVYDRLAQSVRAETGGDKAFETRGEIPFGRVLLKHAKKLSKDNKIDISKSLWDLEVKVAQYDAEQAAKAAAAARLKAEKEAAAKAAQGK